MAEQMQQQSPIVNLDATTLKAILQEKSQRVVFEKADGTLRVMHCTTNPKIVPWPDNPVEATGSVQKEKDPNLIVVWDLEKEGWRSFRFERLREYGDLD